MPPMKSGGEYASWTEWQDLSALQGGVTSVCCTALPLQCGGGSGEGWRRWPIFLGKVAVITGAASGIGRAGVRAFAAAGAQVIVADINEKNGQAVVEETGAGKAAFQKVDVRDSQSVQRMAANTVAKFGRIDALFHNAMNVPLVNKGDGRATELPEETWHEIVNLVLNSTFYCCEYQPADTAKIGFDHPDSDDQRPDRPGGDRRLHRGQGRRNAAAPALRRRHIRRKACASMPSVPALSKRPIKRPSWTIRPTRSKTCI